MAQKLPKQSNLRQVFTDGTWEQSNTPSARIDHINVNDIEVPDYQRIIKDHKLKKLIREWSPARVGYVLLSLRADGRLYVVDGQHRVEAVRHLQGRIGPYIESIVREGMTSQEEAEFFAESQNPANRAQLLPEDIHRAAVMYGNADAIAVSNVVTAAGFYIGSRSAKDGTTRIKAVDAVKDIHKNYGAQTLYNTLMFYKSAWEPVTPPNQVLINGISLFFTLYPAANIESLLKVAAKQTSKDFLEDARKRAQTDRLSASQGVASLLCLLYNRRNSRKPLANFEEQLRNHSAAVRSAAARAARQR